MPDERIPSASSGHNPARFWRSAGGDVVPYFRPDAERDEVALVIANGASLTASEPSLGGQVVPVGLWTPAAWTAAAISFLVSRDGGANFVDAFDDQGIEIAIPALSIPTGAARRFAINPRLFLGVTNLRIRSGLTGAAVNQAAARTLVLITRPIA